MWIALLPAVSLSSFAFAVVLNGVFKWKKNYFIHSKISYKFLSFFFFDIHPLKFIFNSIFTEFEDRLHLPYILFIYYLLLFKSKKMYLIIHWRQKYQVKCDDVTVSFIFSFFFKHRYKVSHFTRFYLLSFLPILSVCVYCYLSKQILIGAEKNKEAI